MKASDVCGCCVCGGTHIGTPGNECPMYTASQSIIATLTAERDDMIRVYRLEHEKHTAALATIEALHEELARWKVHEPGCPALCDDASDQVLSDFQRCTCAPALREELAQAQNAAAVAH
jgi:hypothetical protein